LPIEYYEVESLTYEQRGWVLPRGNYDCLAKRYFIAQLAAGRIKPRATVPSAKWQK